MDNEKDTERNNGITVIDDKSDSGIWANIIGLTKGKELVLKNLDKLINGELDEPIDTHASIMHTRLILKRLEKLRLKMLTDKIAYEEQVDGFNDQIAGVAHDLKTPIATIAGYAECLQDGFDDKDYPALISERAKIMNSHVISLVNRIRADREERERTLVGAYGYFAGVFNSLVPVAEAKKIKLTVKKIPKVSLYIDKRQIGRVCQNIVSNAVKATKEGGKITVKFRTDGKYLYIKIKDNGCGIEKENLKYVFDKFFTGDKARSSGNSGLGLYLVKEFVEAHGGHVGVKSKIKKGTAFTIALPIVYEEAKLPSTRRFERCSRAVKLPIVLLFVVFFPFFFRLVRFFETFNVSTLLAALFLTIPFFLVFWFVDFFSMLVYGKITFLAD